MDINAIKFHQLVATPDGCGMVQGALREMDGSVRKVLVSHTATKDPTLGKRRGIWRLAAYLPEQLELYHRGE